MLTLIWLGFVGYTLWLAPLDYGSTWEIGKKLLSLHWTELNAYLVAIFCLMGVWPMIYACLMFADGRMQNFRVWPYFIGSNGTGVICLLPYLILRQPSQTFEGPKDFLLQSLDSRRTGQALFVTTLLILFYAFFLGDWGDFVWQWQTHPFVHLISLDFCLMCLLFPLSTLFSDDMARRGLSDRRIYWAVALFPLIGPLLYLCFRPSLLVSQSSSTDRDQDLSQANPVKPRAIAPSNSDPAYE